MLAELGQQRLLLQQALGQRREALRHHAAYHLHAVLQRLGQLVLQQALARLCADAGALGQQLDAAAADDVLAGLHLAAGGGLDHMVQIVRIDTVARRIQLFGNRLCLRVRHQSPPSPNTLTQLPPCALASYIALSAWRSKVSGSLPAPG